MLGLKLAKALWVDLKKRYSLLLKVYLEQPNITLSAANLIFFKATELQTARSTDPSYILSGLYTMRTPIDFARIRAIKSLLVLGERKHASLCSRTQSS